MLDLQQFMQNAGQEFQVHRDQRVFGIAGVENPEIGTITFYPDADIRPGDRVSAIDSEDAVYVTGTQPRIYNQQPFALVAEYETDSGDENRTTDTNGTSTLERYALATIVVACLLVTIGAWISDYSTEAFVAFVGTLVATLAGVGIAAYVNLRLFYREAQDRQDDQRQRLIQALAAELFTVLDILNGTPHVRVPNPQNPNIPIPVVLAQLEPTATEEAIRFGAGVFKGTSTAALSQLSNLMREYSKASEVLYPLVREWQQVAPTTDREIWRSSYIASYEVLRLRENLTRWCNTGLVGLIVQGAHIEDIPRYRSDPSRIAQYGEDPEFP